MYSITKERIALLKRYFETKDNDWMKGCEKDIIMCSLPFISHKELDMLDKIYNNHKDKYMDKIVLNVEEYEFIKTQEFFLYILVSLTQKRFVCVSYIDKYVHVYRFVDKDKKLQIGSLYMESSYEDFAPVFGLPCHHRHNGIPNYPKDKYSCITLMGKVDYYECIFDIIPRPSKLLVSEKTPLTITSYM